MKQREHSTIYPLHILFWSSIIMGSIIFAFIDLKDYTFVQVLYMIKEYISTNSIIDIITEFIFLLFVLVYRTGTMFLPLTITYLAITIGYAIFSIIRLDKVDFKSKEYYREILPSMSAAVLSYIDDFKISYRDIVATLMGLELKNKIKIGNDITIITADEVGLCENEKYILKLIKTKELKNINLGEFKKKVEQDCLENDLIENRKQAKKSRAKYIIWCIIIYILVILLFNTLIYVINLINNHTIEMFGAMITMILFLVVVLYPIIAIYSIFSYMTFNEIEPYVRTISGKKINGRLEGLRRYIKEYSLLSEKNKEAVTLWKEYLIYSVILGANNKIVRELTERFIK